MDIQTIIVSFLVIAAGVGLGYWIYTDYKSVTNDAFNVFPETEEPSDSDEVTITTNFTPIADSLIVPAEEVKSEDNSK